MCRVSAAIVEPKVDHFMKKCVRKDLRAVHEIVTVQPDHSVKQISLAKPRFHSIRQVNVDSKAHGAFRLVSKHGQKQQKVMQSITPKSLVWGIGHK